MIKATVPEGPQIQGNQQHPETLRQREALAVTVVACSSKTRLAL